MSKKNNLGFNRYPLQPSDLKSFPNFQVRYPQSNRKKIPMQRRIRYPYLKNMNNQYQNVNPLYQGGMRRRPAWSTNVWNPKLGTIVTRGNRGRMRKMKSIPEVGGSRSIQNSSEAAGTRKFHNISELVQRRVLTKSNQSEFTSNLN